ncbi:MAG: hypothetical protein ABL888_20710 [Pirellulaceae bacterium]
MGHDANSQSSRWGTTVASPPYTTGHAGPHPAVHAHDGRTQNVGPKPPSVRFEMEAFLGGGSVNIGVRHLARFILREGGSGTTKDTKSTKMEFEDLSNRVIG